MSMIKLTNALGRNTRLHGFWVYVRSHPSHTSFAHFKFYNVRFLFLTSTHLFLLMFIVMMFTLLLCLEEVIANVLEICLDGFASSTKWGDHILLIEPT